MVTIRQILHRVVVRPMKTTFATSLGAKTAATSVLVKVVLSDGSAGRGEVPTSFVMPHETPEAIKHILVEARKALGGVPIDDYPPALAAFRNRHEPFRMTLAGLEVATFRASLACRGRSELQHWGGRLRRLRTDITIPLVSDPDAIAAWLNRIIPLGFAAYKVKVSGDVPRDAAFVTFLNRSLRERLPGFAIRLDGNQAYTAGSYLRMVKALAKARIDIELFEQPLRKDDFRGLRQIRRRGAAPVILDETVFCRKDCRRVIDEDLADGVNIKIAKSGIAESAAILQLAKSAGLKLMIGCMTETMVGLSAGIRMAAGCGQFDFVDLDSIHFLHDRRRHDGIAVEGCRYVLEEG
jgi:L-alanine-DL-glutamate epimerase-like enolase superfamily enzyme